MDSVRCRGQTGPLSCFNQTGQRFDKIFEWIAINDGQFAVFDEALNEPTRRFYRQLSHAAASGRVVLLGIRRGGDRGMDCTHEQIDPKNFIGKKVHDLDSNELREPKKPNAPAALPPSSSNVPNSLNWTDVKVSLAHATMLLLEFSSKVETVDIQKRGTLQDWNPNWLSLGGAMMWTITRDHQETQLADKLGAGSRGAIKLGIAAQLAYREHETGSRPRFHVKISEAWLVIRRLIADETCVFGETLGHGNGL